MAAAGLFGLAAPALGAYLAWDFAPRLSAGRGGMYGIAICLLAGGAFMTSGVVVAVARRRRAGRGLRGALGLAAGGALWLGWTAIPMTWGLVSDRALRSPTTLAGVAVLGALLLLGCLLVILLVLGRRTLARLPARARPRRRVLHWYVGWRELLLFAPLGVAGAVALYVAAQFPAPPPELRDLTRRLRRPAGREERLAAMVALGARSAPEIVAWMGAAEEAGLERRELVESVVHEFTGGEAPVPVLSALFGNRFAVDRVRDRSVVGWIALERIAARDPRILGALRELLAHGGDPPDDVAAHAVASHGAAGARMVADVLAAGSPNPWRNARLLARLAHLDPALAPAVIQGLRDATASPNRDVRSAAYHHLPTVDTQCGPWLRAGIDDSHLSIAETAVRGYLELESISGEDEARLREALADRDQEIAEAALAALVRHRPSDASLDERVRAFWGAQRWYGSAETTMLLAITGAGPAARRHLAPARGRYARAIVVREFVTASGAIGGPEAIRDLRRAAGFGRYKYAAAFGHLARWSPDEARALTEGLLGDRRPRVRALALIAARRAESLPASVIETLRGVAVNGTFAWERLRARVLLALHAGEEAAAVAEARGLIRAPTQDCRAAWALGLATRLGPAAAELVREMPEVPTEESLSNPHRWWIAARIAEGDQRVRAHIGLLDWYW